VSDCIPSDGVPFVLPLTDAPSPHEALRRLAALSHPLLLESACRHPQRGRYSFLAVDPFDFQTVRRPRPDILDAVGQRAAGWATPAVEGLPPFQGGMAGLLGYELGGSFEQLPRPRFDEFQLPVLAVGWYDLVVAWDHLAGSAWIVSQGLPETDRNARRQRAQRRGQWLARLLDGGYSAEGVAPSRAVAANAGAAARGPSVVPRANGHRPLPSVPGLTSNFSRESYLAAAGRAIEYVAAGDVFQVNLAQRLLLPAGCPSIDLYESLRRVNPAPMAGYFDLGQFQVISASPERFVQLRDGLVETRPIKGTRPRTGRPAVDEPIADELRACAKDRAENVMIVDLMRNDLTRVCQPASVRVSQVCEVEQCQYVMHLVSAVEGRLREGRTGVDLLRAAFPGGSVTGAPKIRAMEIIAELEQVARGAYCGSLGYLGLDGSMDLSILIRTITAGGGWWQFPVGGGVVADSDPLKEYQETWHKAEGLLRAIADAKMEVATESAEERSEARQSVR